MSQWTQQGKKIGEYGNSLAEFQLDRNLTMAIKALHERHSGTYGCELSWGFNDVVTRGEMELHYEKSIYRQLTFNYYRFIYLFFRFIDNILFYF